MHNKSIAGIDSKTGVEFEIDTTLSDGRRVYKVPKKKWLSLTQPELETSCIVCGNAIRYNKFIIQGTNGNRCSVCRSVPKTHNGACAELLKDNRILKRVAKDTIRRREDIKKISHKRLDLELFKITKSANRFDIKLSRLMDKK